MHLCVFYNFNDLVNNFSPINRCGHELHTYSFFIKRISSIRISRLEKRNFEIILRLNPIGWDVEKLKNVILRVENFSWIQYQKNNNNNGTSRIFDDDNISNTRLQCIGVVTIRHACSFKCFLFLFSGLISTSMTWVTPCKLKSKEKDSPLRVSYVRGSVLDQSARILAKSILPAISKTEVEKTLGTRLSCSCPVTSLLLLRYCSAAVPLLLRHWSVTAMLRLCYCSATAPLLLSVLLLSITALCYCFGTALVLISHYSVIACCFTAKLLLWYCSVTSTLCLVTACLSLCYSSFILRCYRFCMLRLCYCCVAGLSLLYFSSINGYMKYHNLKYHIFELRRMIWRHHWSL